MLPKKLFAMLPRLTMLLIGLMLILNMLIGCESGSPARDNYCALAKPIYISEADTEDTKRQADEINAVWLEQCGEHK